jgi:ribonuclease HI
MAAHRIDWNWGERHDGHTEHERCDTLANLAVLNGK